LFLASQQIKLNYSDNIHNVPVICLEKKIKSILLAGFISFLLRYILFSSNLIFFFFTTNFSLFYSRVVAIVALNSLQATTSLPHSIIFIKL